MKIVHKMTLAFLAGTCAILAVNGVRRVRREVTLFESNEIGDHRSLGRTMRTTVAAVWTTAGEARALELVDEANVQHGRVHFRWLWLDTAPPVHVSLDTLRKATPQDALSAVDRDESGGQTRFTYVPVAAPNGRPAVLELSESLASELAYVRRTIVDSLVTTATLAAVCGLLAMALGVLLVGRPVARLVDKARRIGTGDFGGPLAVAQRDELGELAMEMNAMCDRLERAQREVATQTSRRIATLEQLRHADRLSTVGKLASGIAHELGTPLNVISGRADMIAGREAQGDDALDSARVIKQASDRMAAIIRQLMDFARRRGPQRSNDDLAAVARQTIGLLGTIAQKKGITLALEAKGEVRADVDAGQIQQALTNLLVNAIQAAPERSTIEVTVGREPVCPPSDLGSEPGSASEHAFLRVHDHGPGIPAELRERIFEPFFTTKGVGEGTGLGLSVTWGIARDHGGFIVVDDQQKGRAAPDDGTTFTLYLPLHDRVEAQGAG